LHGRTEGRGFLSGSDACKTIHFIDVRDEFIAASLKPFENKEKQQIHSHLATRHI